jgi:hypothetical protein
MTLTCLDYAYRDIHLSIISAIIEKENQLVQDGDAHQVHILIDVIRCKSLFDKGNHVAWQGQRRQQGKIDPLQLRGGGYRIFTLFKGRDKLDLHVFTSQRTFPNFPTSNLFFW